MKRLSLSVILLLCILIACPAFSQPYSLADLFRIALERSNAIKVGEEDLNIAEQGRNKAKAALLPTLSAFGYHTKYSEKQIEGDALLQPDHTNEWGLRLDQTLSLSGRELTAYKIAGDTIAKSEFDLNALKEDYLLRVATQYYTVLRAQKDLDISQTNVARLRKHRDAARTRLEVGETTKTVLLRAEAELTGAQSELITSENNLQIALVRLAKTAGIIDDYTVTEPILNMDDATPEAVLQIIGTSSEDCQMTVMDCLKATAISLRAEIKSMTLQKNIAQDEVKYMKGAYWPSLSIVGEYYRQENDPSTTFGLEKSIYGGLRLDFPFFEGGLRRSEVREAEARLHQAEHRLADLKDEILLNVENSYLILQKEAAVLKEVQAELAFARENHTSVTKQFQYGLADSLDTIDANTLLVTSERDLANAKYAYQLALINLRRATGILLTSFQTGNPQTIVPDDNK